MRNSIPHGPMTSTTNSSRFTSVENRKKHHHSYPWKTVTLMGGTENANRCSLSNHFNVQRQHASLTKSQRIESISAFLPGVAIEYSVEKESPELAMRCRSQPVYTADILSKSRLLARFCIP